MTENPPQSSTNALSESVCSFEPSEPHDPSLSHLARSAFDKASDYLQGELMVMKENYKLLENLNTATAAKYSDMRQISGNVYRSFEELNSKYKSLDPLLCQLIHIEESVNKLEHAAYKLDAYSKRLEAKFKALEKQ